MCSCGVCRRDNVPLGCAPCVVLDLLPQMATLAAERDVRDCARDAVDAVLARVQDTTQPATRQATQPVTEGESSDAESVGSSEWSRGLLAKEKVFRPVAVPVVGDAGVAALATSLGGIEVANRQRRVKLLQRLVTLVQDQCEVLRTQAAARRQSRGGEPEAAARDAGDSTAGEKKPGVVDETGVQEAYLRARQMVAQATGEYCRKVNRVVYSGDRLFLAPILSLPAYATTPLDTLNTHLEGLVKWLVLLAKAHAVVLPFWEVLEFADGVPRPRPVEKTAEAPPPPPLDGLPRIVLASVAAVATTATTTVSENAPERTTVHTVAQTRPQQLHILSSMGMNTRRRGAGKGDSRLPPTHMSRDAAEAILLEVPHGARDRRASGRRGTVPLRFSDMDSDMLAKVAMRVAMVVLNVQELRMRLGAGGPVEDCLWRMARVVGEVAAASEGRGVARARLPSEAAGPTFVVTYGPPPTTLAALTKDIYRFLKVDSSSVVGSPDPQ